MSDLEALRCFLIELRRGLRTQVAAIDHYLEALADSASPFLTEEPEEAVFLSGTDDN
jgi:hypothetical protein